MGWSAALNVALGLALLFLVFSVAASRINEFVAARLQWRAKGLERALRTMLGGPDPPRQSIATPNDGTPVDPTTGTTADAGTAQLSAGTVKDHPIVAGFESVVGRNRRISYLPSRAFSATVLDILAPPPAVILDSITTDDVPDQRRPAVEAAVNSLRAHPDANHLRELEAVAPDSPPWTTTLTRLKTAMQADVLVQARAAVLALPAQHPARRTLLRMLADAGDERDAFRAKLEHWYDDEMSRLTGWYKRYVQRFIIAYGAALTFAFNVDAINIAQTLWRSPVEQAAAAQAAASAAGRTVSDIDTSVSAIKGLAIPVGWTPTHDGTRINTDPRHVPPLSAGPWAVKVLGLAITVFALAFGAPFWFDVLGKLARLRNAGGVTSTTNDTQRP